MSVVFLIHHIADEIQSLRHAADMVCAMYGYHLRVIDTEGGLRALSREPYVDLDEALTDPRFDGWQWVFADADGATPLEEFQHPADNVVYVFGHDVNGFDRDVSLLPGSTVSLKSVHSSSYEHHALACLATMAVHRFYQTDIVRAGVMAGPLK